MVSWPVRLLVVCLRTGPGRVVSDYVCCSLPSPVTRGVTPTVTMVDGRSSDLVTEMCLARPHESRDDMGSHRTGAIVRVSFCTRRGQPRQAISRTGLHPCLLLDGSRALVAPMWAKRSQDRHIAPPCGPSTEGIEDSLGTSLCRTKRRRNKACVCGDCRCHRLMLGGVSLLTHRDTPQRPTHKNTGHTDKRQLPAQTHTLCRQYSATRNCTPDRFLSSSLSLFLFLFHFLSLPLSLPLSHFGSRL